MSDLVSPSSQPAMPEPEIHTIPEEFYGSAIHAKLPEEKKSENLAVPPLAPSKRHWPIVVMVIVLIFAIGGGFLYFNQELLFPPPIPSPAPKQETPPPPPPPPVAPSNLVATSTNSQSVTVSWVDTASDESGFRLERRLSNGVFAPLTSLPPNSTSFLDVSVQADQTYFYRLRALNASGESEASNEASATVPPLPPPPPTAPQLPPAGLDTESDGLTDLEESLYGTDARTPDSDGDGFLDGNEAFHLYNPAGKAPGRLVDSALIKAYPSQIGWVLSVPTSWSLRFDVVDGSRATIDSGHGETFAVAIEENPDKKPILDWYKERYPDVNLSQVLQYRSKGGYVGIIGTDLLTTYVPWGDRIFTFTYALNGQPFINYRTTYSMILNSLMLSGLPQITPTPPGTPLPFEPSPTTTGVTVPPIPVQPLGGAASSTEASSVSTTSA